MTGGSLFLLRPARMIRPDRGPAIRGVHTSLPELQIVCVEKQVEGPNLISQLFQGLQNYPVGAQEARPPGLERRD